jgi:hypothetical protein
MTNGCETFWGLTTIQAWCELKLVGGDVTCGCLQGNGRGLRESEDPGSAGERSGTDLSKKKSDSVPVAANQTASCPGGEIDMPLFSKAQPPIKQRSLPHV